MRVGRVPVKPCILYARVCQFAICVRCMASYAPCMHVYASLQTARGAWICMHFLCTDESDEE